MASWTHGAAHLRHIGGAIGRIGEEMKDSPVMPDVDTGLCKLDCCDVALHPVHALCRFAQPLARHIERSAGDIQHTHIRHAMGKQVIHQT